MRTFIAAATVTVAASFASTPICPVPEVPELSIPENTEQRLLEAGVADEIRPSKCPNNGGKNVIMVVGDGMGWEMIRAGAIAKQVLAELDSLGVDVSHGATNSDTLKATAKAAFAGRTTANYYTSGKGSGLSFQELPGYAIVTTSTMVIQEANEGAHYSPSGQSMLVGSTRQGGLKGINNFTTGHENGQAPLATDKDGKPLVFDPRDYESEGGMMVLWDDLKGGKWPWDSNYYKPAAERSPGFDIRFKGRHATDSASTAGSLATGVKSFTGGLSVDIYERPARTIVEDAMHCGKAAGVVTSVPMLHATPAAFITHSNHRYNGPQMQRNMMETVNPTMAIGTCVSRYYPGGKYMSEHDIDYTSRIDNGWYGNWTRVMMDDGSTREETLAKMAALDPNKGDRLLGCTSTSMSNMPYRGVDSGYSDAVTQGSPEVTEDLEGNAIDMTAANNGFGHAYTPEVVAKTPKMAEIVKSSIEFLGKNDKGFFMMYEQGDIDWAAHSDHMDDMLGAMLDIDDSVREIMTWIDANGGYEKNALFVTADHDHFLTLKPNFPEVIANFLIDGESHKITPSSTISGGYEGKAKLPDFKKGDEVISDPNGAVGIKELQGWAEGTIDQVGHFWGVEEDGGNAWGSHSSKPVPLSYGGDNGCINKMKGRGYKVFGKEVRGSPDKIDQVHVHDCAFAALMGY